MTNKLNFSFFSLLFQAYGENMTKFKEQLTANELALFSNETLNRVLFEVPLKVKLLPFSNNWSSSNNRPISIF